VINTTSAICNETVRLQLATCISKLRRLKRLHGYRSTCGHSPASSRTVSVSLLVYIKTKLGFLYEKRPYMYFSETKHGRALGQPPPTMVRQPTMVERRPYAAYALESFGTGMEPSDNILFLCATLHCMFFLFATRQTRCKD